MREAGIRARFKGNWGKEATDLDALQFLAQRSLVPGGVTALQQLLRCLFDPPLRRLACRVVVLMLGDDLLQTLFHLLLSERGGKRRGERDGGTISKHRRRSDVNAQHRRQQRRRSKSSLFDLTKLVGRTFLQRLHTRVPVRCREGF